MIDLELKLARFEELAGECELIAKLATDNKKRELFLRVGGHYRDLATDLKTAINRMPKATVRGLSA
ncbi:hypothetical protein [Bradyrhizobium sp. BR13661]|uniref:hypothetical protein n=1 Tax=Bradyrhizobium sp. BR13661 TaxID=2940622 RepID=UPI00247592CC|nr:hypothetical protein [Bradyrhizobium sp. BR13661]MDH6263527.1 hypothetical protein [Bradyrhizobium sp. BR13661]